jgi:hypothetical protein
MLLGAVFAGSCLAAPQYGQLLPCEDEGLVLWWCSSGWKVASDQETPDAKGEAILISAARNEAEAAQLVVYPKRRLGLVGPYKTALAGPGGSSIPADNVEVLRVRYVKTELPTDKSTTVGQWPDPLPGFEATELAANRNQPLWIRVKVPKDVPAGTYRGKVGITGNGMIWSVPLEVEVYDFDLPERMTCTTAFGFSPGNVWRYQNLKTDAQKREVLDKYWANFSAHHISPYDPAPLDSISTTWPAVKPPQSKWANWEGVRIVDNEVYGGNGALLIYDDNQELNVTIAYKPAIPIGAAGLRLRFRYRTAVPGHRFIVSLNHYDADGKWIYGGNNDIQIAGDGRWQEFDKVITSFPKNARSVRLSMRATIWTDAGEETGLVWFDDVSITDAGTGKEFVEGGDFDTIKRTQTVVPTGQLQVKLDFARWDKAMSRAIDHYAFNSFRLAIPGMGGGTFHEISYPSLLGFKEDDPEYAIMFDSYCRQMQKHLGDMGWLDEAYVYWFDEPSPDQYGFVMNGFEKLKRSCPSIARMLTEQPEKELEGGPNIYCVISDLYRHDSAEKRRVFGDRFWWYVCTGPKAPYCTLFIDHPATEMRVWLWQSWQRNIEGILVWETNYWTSSAAYSDPGNPQNPYEDPMGWVSGYSTPAGKKQPWGNGDGRFIYPPEAAADAHPKEAILDGPVDSIRWEMLRDGIEDYEYLAVLKRLIAEKKTRLNSEQTQRFDSLLEVPASITQSMTDFTKDPRTIEARRHEIAGAIVELSRL